MPSRRPAGRRPPQPAGRAGGGAWPTCRRTPATRPCACPTSGPSARLDDAALEHLVALFERVARAVDCRPARAGAGGARRGAGRPGRQRRHARRDAQAGQLLRGDRAGRRPRPSPPSATAGRAPSPSATSPTWRPTSGSASPGSQDLPAVHPVDQRPAPPGHLRSPAQPDRRDALGPLGDRPDPGPLRPRPPRAGRLRGVRPPAGGGQLLRRGPAGARAGGRPACWPTPRPGRTSRSRT